MPNFHSRAATTRYLAIICCLLQLLCTPTIRHKLKVGSHMVIQNTQTKGWDIYGIVTVISPEQRYYIKARGGRVLVCNHCFLHCRIPTSIPDHTTQSGCSQPPTPQPPPPWRSSREKKPPRRLIEDSVGTNIEQFVNIAFVLTLPKYLKGEM